MRRRALITGITGQTGSYMAEFLLEKDYEVFGLVRRSSSQNLWRIHDIVDRIQLIEGDITDESSLKHAVILSKPQEVYHFAAQTHVGTSFIEPLCTSEITALGALRLFETVRTYTSLSEAVRVYQASSSEQFGQALISPQVEETPMRPVSPYGTAKLFAHTMAQVYRKSYGMFIACGIAFNHESPRRSEEFVTRKITRGIALIQSRQLETLKLGNLAAQRDWSHAKDIVRGVWQILQQNRPEDFILASGEVHSVQEFVELAFNYAGLDWQRYVRTSPTLYRPTDIQSLVGYAGKAFQTFGWRPRYRFADLVKEMVDADLAAVGAGHSSSSERSGAFDSASSVHQPTELPQGSAQSPSHYGGKL